MQGRAMQRGPCKGGHAWENVMEGNAKKDARKGQAREGHAKEGRAREGHAWGGMHGEIRGSGRRV
eukprot:1161741-Pelagomonas_calceolata.AAC.3